MAEPTTANPPKSAADGSNITRLRDLTPMQWKSGIAAWLGWLFDGMDGTLYTVVAATFVAQLLQLNDPTDPSVKAHSSWIQFAFLIGWATGGAFFGHIGDRFGRARTISITILTYALFTGLSAFAWNWQSLLVFRFLAALGIGGEWAAGSSLISETWPKKWRPWISAVLQSAYQGGYFLASATVLLLAHSQYYPRIVFVVGALPALLVFWIRRAIPEPEEWHAAKQEAKHKEPGIIDLFRGDVLWITIPTILLCSAALTTVWALIFWMPQQLIKIPDIQGWPRHEIEQYKNYVVLLTTFSAAIGNFFAAFIARTFGYRHSAAVMFFGGLVTMTLTYYTERNHTEMIYYLFATHFFVQGIFGLFPLYVPPLFPTLLRTTGAGFCYNIGRVAAAFGTVYFGRVSSPRLALLYVGFVYIPAIAIALIIPEPDKSEKAATGERIDFD